MSVELTPIISLFLVLCTLFIVLYYVHSRTVNNQTAINKMEHYLNYKSNTVTLTDETLSPLRISVGLKFTIYHYLNTIIETIYPIKIVHNNGSSYQNIEDVLSGKSDVAICQLDAAINAHQGNPPFQTPNPEIRFITSVFTEKITLLVRTHSSIYSWTDLKNKKICAGNTKMGSYHNFKDLLHLAGLSNEEVTIIKGDVFSPKILKKFERGEIDALYMTDVHPNADIYELYHRVRFRIIGSKGLNINLLKIRYPNIIKTTISLINYNIKENSRLFLDTYGIPTVFITTTRVKPSAIASFLKTLFQNIEYIRNYTKPNDDTVNYFEQEKTDRNIRYLNSKKKKNKKNKKNIEMSKEATLKLLLSARQQKNFGSSFNKKILQSLLPSELLKLNGIIPLHEGAHKYYTDIGIINTVDSKYCLNSAGIKNCGKIQEYKHYGHGHFAESLPPLGENNLQYQSRFLLKI